jgi:hypothetical protein
MGDRGEVVEWYGMGQDPGPGFRIGATCGRDTSYSDDDEEEVKEGSAAVASGVQYSLRGSTSRPRVTREAEVMASAIGDVVVGVHVSRFSASTATLRLLLRDDESKAKAKHPALVR